MWLFEVPRPSGIKLCLVLLHPPLVTQTVKNLPAVQETWVWSLGWEDPLEKGVATHCSSPAWEIHGQETSGQRPWGCRESDTLTAYWNAFLSFTQCMSYKQVAPSFFSPVLYSRFSAAPCSRGLLHLAEGGSGLLCVIRQSICEQWAELAGARGGKQEARSEPRWKLQRPALGWEMGRRSKWNRVTGGSTGLGYRDPSSKWSRKEGSDFMTERPERRDSQMHKPGLHSSVPSAWRSPWLSFGRPSARSHQRSLSAVPEPQSSLQVSSNSFNKEKVETRLVLLGREYWILKTTMWKESHLIRCQCYYIKVLRLLGPILWWAITEKSTVTRACVCTCMYVWLSHFAVQQKLTQYCTATTLQFFKTVTNRFLGPKRTQCLYKR